MNCATCNAVPSVHKYITGNDNGDRILIDDPEGLPTRYAVRNKQKVAYFCSAKCSLDWYEKYGQT